MTIYLEELNAGDTWSWVVSDLVDTYPASDGWVLSYVLISGTEKITFSALDNGDKFQVLVPAATTASYVDGKYGWAAFVLKDGDRFGVGSGNMEVLPDLVAATNADTRSHASKTLEAIEAVIQKRASKDQNSYEIDGRKLERMSLPDLLTFRKTYRREVYLEDLKNKGKSPVRYIKLQY